MNHPYSRWVEGQEEATGQRGDYNTVANSLKRPEGRSPGQGKLPYTFQKRKNSLGARTSTTMDQRKARGQKLLIKLTRS